MSFTVRCDIMWDVGCGMDSTGASHKLNLAALVT